MEGLDEASLPKAYEQVKPVIDWAVESRLAKRSNGTLRLTRRGHAVANEIFVRLLDPTLL